MKNTILVGMLTGMIFGMLAGCVPQPATMIPTSTRPELTVANTPALLTVMPSLAYTRKPTSTPTTTRTPTPIATITPEKTCPTRVTGLQPGFLSPGVIVFIESDRMTFVRYIDYLYILSSQNPELHPFMEDLSQGILGDFHVSPNGKWLAFGQEIRDGQRYINSLIVTTSNAAERRIIPWDEENWSYMIKGWLSDNQHLMIIPRYDHPVSRKDEVIIFNPFTGEQQRISPSFTYGENSFLVDGGWGTVGLDVVYDSTLTRVAYLEDDDTIILWDTENLRELWRFVEPVLMSREEPTWSPDGSYLAVVDLVSDDNFLDRADEFQIVLADRYGAEVWRSKTYPFYDKWYVSMHFSWSPDGKYLVFRWMVPEDGEQRTFLLDTAKMEVLDFCIDGSFPVWSPDSRQFIMRETIPAQSPEGEETYRNVLVDMERNIVVQIDDITLRPVAWITIDQ